MYTLRCTQKLLRRVGQTPERDPPSPTTLLGDWYANVVMVGRSPFVLAVSERTFLPVVLPLRETKTLLGRIQEQVGEVLVRLRVQQERFENEFGQMGDVHFGRTASRRIVGVMVDFAYALQTSGDRTNTPISLSLWIAQTPCGPLGTDAPDRATRALFEGEPGARGK